MMMVSFFYPFLIIESVDIRLVTPAPILYHYTTVLRISDGRMIAKDKPQSCVFMYSLCGLLLYVREINYLIEATDVGLR